MPAEFRLAVECCRCAFEPGRASGIAEIASGVDWQAFLATTERHRIAGLCWQALEPLDLHMSAAARAQLAARATAIAANGLQAAALSTILSAALERASVPHLFVKGLPVGALAYGSPFIKHSWDIDLLVEEGSIKYSAALLASLGYDLNFPDFGLDWQRLADWHRIQKDSAWTHGETGLMIELHSRLADNRRLIPSVDVSSPRQLVRVTDKISLPTLAWPEMFAHLCVHGASSAWFRLKWISDLAALLAKDGGDLGNLYERSQQLGAGRSAAQALLLAHQLFGTAIPDRLRDDLEASPANRWLVCAAMRALLAPEPGRRPMGTAIIHVSQLLLQPGARFKASEIRRQAAAAMSNLLD